MAYKNLLTYGARVSQSTLLTFAPVATLPVTGLPISTVYCFLSRIDSWPNDNDPPQPLQDQKSIKAAFKNMFVAKQITSNNIGLVAERNDWTYGLTYDYYQDDVDMFQTDANGFLALKFYARNSYDQVFKCLWNNNGKPATVEPVFQPGLFNALGVFTGSDSYKWKYMYTIDTGSKQKFFDTNWIPVPVNNNVVGNNIPNPVSTPAGIGDIEVINVTNPGSGYNPLNPPTVTIYGDGTGATGVASVNSDGTIGDILVTNPGTNYSYATVSITSTVGSGATAIAPVSPIGGHGLDAPSEMGVSHVSLVCEFNGSETRDGIQYLPTDIDYRQVGILTDPLDYNTYLSGAAASGLIYKTTTDVVVASGQGSFNSDDIIYQGTSLSEATFTATVLSFDSINNVIKLINTTGTIANNQSITSTATTSVARTVLGYSTPSLITYSGYISYIQNRTGIIRSSDGVEQFKFVLSF
jgi:hypothetical protein